MRVMSKLSQVNCRLVHYLGSLSAYVSLCCAPANCFGVSLTSLASWSLALLTFSLQQNRSNAAPKVYGSRLHGLETFSGTAEHGSNRVSSAVVGSAKQHHAESSVPAP
jgi:hypothetical protein